MRRKEKSKPGIQRKLLVLILVSMSVLSVTALFSLVYQNFILEQTVRETDGQREEVVSRMTGSVVEEMLSEHMVNSAAVRALQTENQLESLAEGVETLSHYAHQVFTHPDRIPSGTADPPSADTPERSLSTQLLLPEGVAAEDLTDAIGRAAAMTSLMNSLLTGNPYLDSAFIALPDGTTVITDYTASKKVNSDGTPIPFDARTRPWYHQAVEAGELIFTGRDGDFFTNDAEIVCAAPVYVEGELAAVVGMDYHLLFIYEDLARDYEDLMEKFMILDPDGQIILTTWQTGPLSLSGAKALAAGEGDGSLNWHSSQDAGLDAAPGEDGESAAARLSVLTDADLIPALMEDANGDGNTIFTLNVDGVDYYLATAKIDLTDWNSVSAFRRDETIQPMMNLLSFSEDISRSSLREYIRRTRNLILVIISLLLFVTLMAILNILRVSGRITRPLVTMADRISRQQSGTETFQMLPLYETGDEIERLADSFADLSRRSAEYVEREKRTAAEQERMKSELETAARIQSSMLPQVFPTHAVYDLYASMAPARAVGGDFYGFIQVDPGHLCLLIADVSDKGIPAALFMMRAKTVLEELARQGLSPSEIVSQANQALCADNPVHMFVTLWLGILELSTGVLTAVNAGHEYPALRHAGGVFELYRDPHGLVCGALERSRYREYTLTLAPGDQLFLYTDGVPDALSEADERFGTDRMLAALNQAPEADPQQLLARVRDTIDAFVGSAMQADDLTMLSLTWHPDAQAWDPSDPDQP